MTIQEAVKQAQAAGYTGIETFMGPLTLDNWLELTSLKNISYENGKLVTNWLPSILERGELERLTFILTK